MLRDLAHRHLHPQAFTRPSPVIVYDSVGREIARFHRVRALARQLASGRLILDRGYAVVVGGITASEDPAGDRP